MGCPLPAEVVRERMLLSQPVEPQPPTPHKYYMACYRQTPVVMSPAQALGVVPSSSATWPFMPPQVTVSKHNAVALQPSSTCPPNMTYVNKTEAQGSQVKVDEDDGSFSTRSRSPR